jgi:hypothetical protein
MTSVVQLDRTGSEHRRRWPINVGHVADAIFICLVGFFLIAVGPTAFTRAGTTQCGLVALPLPTSGLARLLTVKSGFMCPISLPRGPAGIDDLIVSVPPRHGTVWPDGATGLIYRSDRDFHGEDHFSIARQNRSDPGRHQIAIAITVKVN